MEIRYLARKKVRVAVALRRIGYGTQIFSKNPKMRMEGFLKIYRGFAQ
jgi:hypothetical protein